MARTWHIQDRDIRISPQEPAVISFNNLSEQQIVILYGIITYATVFLVLLVSACVAGYLRRRAETAPRVATEPSAVAAPLYGKGAEATPVPQAA
jgi:hypothetical protein